MVKIPFVLIEGVNRFIEKGVNLPVEIGDSPNLAVNSQVFPYFSIPVFSLSSICLKQ
jgi:hypothetical protein